MSFSFYWHDYETWGVSPRVDRAVQFAGIRTDVDLNIIGKPMMIYAKPADDVLPSPDACLVTGITPQEALRQGVNEADFFNQIHQEFSRPGTCGVGYNTIRFDDEVTRFGFFRNFFDPYAREWQNGNSRWDILDMVRLTYALRPEGIHWSVGDDGKPSFRLEKLTQANDIGHQLAHDALSDVEATIAMARLIKSKQPRLFDYFLKLRNKHEVNKLLSVGSWKPVVHISGMYPAEGGCMAIVIPLIIHPENANGVVVYDLSRDPAELADLTVEEIKNRLFVKKIDLPEGQERIPLKTIHVNKSPAVVPLNTLTEKVLSRWQIDLTQIELHQERIRGIEGLADKIQQVHRSDLPSSVIDVDQSLYSGGFFSRSDRFKMDAIRRKDPQQLKHVNDSYDDERIVDMLFRYRARNWPETLSVVERERWNLYRQAAVMGADRSVNLEQYQQRLAELMVSQDVSCDQREILSALADWPKSIHLVGY